MTTAKEYLGECPICGDEIYAFRSYSRKRYAQCINEECEKKTQYPLPKAGKIEVTGLVCPENQLPILAIIPHLRLNHGRYAKQEKKTYFWTNRPGFTCPRHSQCEIYQEIRQDY